MSINFLAGLFIAAISGTEIFGVISLMVVNAAVFCIITGLGTDSAIVWHGASQKLTHERLFSFTFFSSVVQIALFVIISLFFYKTTHKLLLSRQGNFGFYFYELMYFAGLVLIDKYTSLFYAEQRIEQCNKILAAVTFVCLIIIGMFYYGIFDLGISPFALLCIITFLQACGLFILFHWKNKKLKIVGLSQTELKSFFNFSLIVFFTNLIQFFAYRVDYWLIDFFKNSDQLGIYSQANRFAQLLWVLPNVLAAMLIPIVAFPESNFREKEVVRIIRVVNYFNILAIAGIIIIALFFYNYFLPKKFSNGFFAILLMMPGYYFFAINILLAAFFSSRRKLWINFTGSAICFMVIIVADIFLIPRYGIEGAALADSIAYSAAAIFSIILFMKHSQFSIAEFFRFDKTDWKQLLIRELKTH
jgi:O-antigen/teichoic acid export membrane protein